MKLFSSFISHHSSLKISVLIFSAVFLCSATEFRVKPGDGSFDKAAKNWKKGDSIILAPGTYYNRFAAGDKTHAPCGLTIKAEIPGTAIFRGDRPAPKFQAHNKNIWKAHWDSIPETVFERDTLRPYTYYATLTGLEQQSGAWTYDAKTKTLYIRTTDSGDPARHCLSIGVIPWSGFSFYCHPASSGIQDVLLDGFITTGYYTRVRFPDERIASSQYKTAWGVVISHPTKNVKIHNVTAVLNGYGIGYCAAAKNSSIENCRAFGNRNPFNSSGGGIGIFNGADNCVLRNNTGADNVGNDVWLYAGPITPTTIFENNKGYGSLRTKATKQKGFVVKNCVAQSISFIDYLHFMSNCVTFGYTPLSGILKKTNLLMRYENTLNADEIFADPANMDCRLQEKRLDERKEKTFADPANLDCRVQGGIDPSLAKRGLTFSSDKIFYWKQNGKDSADGHSVKNAFGSAGRVLKELAKPGTEIYVAGAVKGDLKLKGLKDIAIRGRGKFPVAVQGKIILENCSNVKLERLAPAEFTVQGGSNILITQSAGKISVNKVNGLYIKHNYIPVFTLKDCTKCFITANVFEKTQVTGLNGWIDYNAYAGKVPANEKNSFTAKAQLGKNFTFQNAWQFDGRAINAMPVGPYRRQPRNVQLTLGKPEVQVLAPDTVTAKITSNIPVTGILRWGDPVTESENEIKLSTESNTQTAAISGLKPGKKYYVQFKMNAYLPECFSNAELKNRTTFRKGRTDLFEFTTSTKIQPAREYFVAKTGSDLNDGSKAKPFGTIGYAVTKLRPGDTLTINNGVYQENFSVPVSGTKEKPIVIQGIRGGKVVLCGGYGAPLVGGILVTNQNYIHFKDMAVLGNYSYSEGYTEYAFRAVNCKGLLFKRVIVGGAAHKINAIDCDDIVAEDCAFSGGHEGVYYTNCQNQVFRNCTFAYAGLMHLMIRNENGGKITLENCIILDALNMKGFNSVIFFHDISKLTERNNCYYNRMPFDQKPLIGWNFNGKVKAVQNAWEGSREFPYSGRSQQPYPAYQKDLNRYNTGSFAANPGLKVFPEFKAVYKSFADWKANWKKKNDVSWTEGQATRDNPEILFELKNFAPTNPEVIKRGCGVRP